MRCFLVFLAVLQLAAGTEPFSKHSHHHVAASQLRTVSPLALSAFERESWLQGAFATSLHERHSSDINSCIACEVVVQLVQWAVDSNVTLDTVETLATLYCEYKKIYGGFPDVCSGMIREDGPEILYVFTHKCLDPRSVCTFLKFCTSSTPAVPPGWDSDSVLSLRPAPPARRKPRSVGTFAHISDIHLDVQYTVGCDSNCGKPLCCRPENGYPSDPSAAAQPFGEPSCDTSRALLASLADFVQTLPAVDFVVWTGDEPPHDVWEQSRSENENATAEVTDAMLRAFGDAMVFPALGNHESFPVDQFEGPGADNWLYDSVASYWSRWLPEDALNSLRYGGFYSALLPGSKLRVVSINSNFANSGNFWLLLETGDVGGQLQWLNTTLAASRAAGERVFLIAHIPWGSAIDAYAQSVHGLVEAYSDVISGQFYGHTHHDQFQVFRDNATNSKPIGISFIAPSITPYGSVFPSFRIYQYDRDTFEVLDYTSYVMNVTAANAAGTATWTEDYHLLSEYGMAGATPSDFQSLVTRMNSDSSLFERYRLHFWRQPHGSCDAGCKKDMLCDAASATGTLYDQCMAAPSTPKTALA